MSIRRLCIRVGTYTNDREPLIFRKAPYAAKTEIVIVKAMYR